MLKWILAGLLTFSIGLLHSQDAPVTTVENLYNQTPGLINVPVTVTGFSSIGAMSLTLEYDPAVLSYLGNTQNAAFSGGLSIFDNTLNSGMHRIIIGWFGNAFSLPDGSALFNLNFNFTGGFSALQWIDDGSSCEYTDQDYNVLNDMPFEDFYINGGVSSVRSLNLSAFIEGLYNPSTLKMNTAAGNNFGEGIADEIQVELHDADNYSTIVYTSGNVLLSTDGQLSLNLPGSLNASYYITIKHRNSIETVSALPVSFAGNETNYNFSDQADNAYGSNMQLVDTGIWAIYSGDVNQDGSIDTGDMTPVDNDAGNFVTGYTVTDVNGDGAVDTGDMTIVDNNASAFVGAILP